MGSVRESQESMAAPKAAPAMPEGVAVPGTPTLGAVPGTPMPHVGPGTPGIGDQVDTGKSPSQQAATSPPASPKEVGDEVVEVPEAPERVSKKQRIEQTQEAVVQLTGLMKTTLEGLQALHDTLKLNTEQQQEMKAEIDALAKQMGSDAITAKVVYTSLADYQRTLSNAAWQLSGHKKESNVSLKEVMLHLEDYARQSSLRLLETKNEVRAQHASTITSIKEVTSAIKSLDTAIRLGTQQNQSMSTGGAPMVGGTTAPPGAGATMSAPPPKAAPPAAATMATPATPATSAVTTATAAEATGIPPAPGYASSASAAAMFPPSAPGAPVFHAPPPMAYQPPPNRAGRLRVSNRDGTVAARAVSPQGRHPTAVTHEWANEYGLGTVNCGGLVYRVLPDSYLEGSAPLN